MKTFAQAQDAVLICTRHCWLVLVSFMHNDRCGRDFHEKIEEGEQIIGSPESEMPQPLQAGMVHATGARHVVPSIRSCQCLVRIWLYG